jgi:hypothetical protein
MTVDRTYRCDLCHDTHDPNRLRGLYWQATVTGHVLVEKPGREVEHHICNRCLEALHAFKLS